MHFGTDFFRIFNFAIQLLRLFARIFGDDEDKIEADASRERTASSDPDEAC